jgi:uncharacterized membrane protein
MIRQWIGLTIIVLMIVVYILTRVTTAKRRQDKSLPVVGIGILLTIVVVFFSDQLPSLVQIPLLVITIIIDTLALILSVREAMYRSF